MVVVKLLISFVILLTGAAILLIPELFKSVNLDYEYNDFCQTNQNISENNLDYLVCDNKFKKKKIILLLIDSLPFDSLNYFHNLKESKMTNFFRGKGLEYKQSGALFETILTGKFSRNYLASIPMKMDNIQKQLYNANLSIFYRIRDFPLYTLFNKTYFKKVEKHFGEGIPLSTLCKMDLKPFESFKEEILKNYFDESGLYFKEGITKEIFYEKANKKLKKEFEKLGHIFDVCFAERDFDSIIFYTDTLDHIIHTSHRNEPFAIFSIYFLEQYINELINWINKKHGEYALALASDHGGQLYFGEDTLCNHGCNSIGNEAVFFVYTKELGENYEKYKNHLEGEEIPIVSLNDFACTFMQTVKNGNLPLETTCTPRYIGNDKLLMFTSVKSKEIQLKKYLEKLIKKYPELKNQYENKYNPKFKNNKFVSYFKNNDSIYQAETIFYKEYMNYLIGIQDELFDDVVQSSHNKFYYLILYSVLILFILGFLYFVRKLILMTREKVFKEIEKTRESKNRFLPRIVSYTYVIVAILLIEPFVTLIFNNSLNISDYIRTSIFLKFIFILFLVIYVTFMNGIKKNNYKFLIFIIAIIIFLNLISSKDKLFSSLDKYINTQPKSDFYKVYFSYPLFVIYVFLEIFSVRKYYLSQKYRIKYIYILVPYIIILSLYMFNYDIGVTVKNYVGNTPERIILLKKVYIMTFLLLLFIKPFMEREKDNAKVISSEIINLKFFLFMILNFICVELERILMIALFNIILLYLCYKFRKEQDLFIKMIFIILIVCYPQIHFIANQGTYTMDTSIKVTIKCPSKWADDRPILMGIIFVVHKFRFDLMAVGYMFCLIKITKKKIMNYYTEFIRLINSIQLFGILICFLYFIKKQRERNYIQILYLIGTHIMPIILFDLAFLINYIFYKILNKFFNASIDEYEILEKLDKEEDLEKNQIN
jgi:hypothetical protein